MKVDHIDDDFFRTVEYQKFLKKNGVRVPSILGVYSEKKEIIFEDLGDLSLYTWLKGKKNLNLIKNMYQAVLDEVVKLHTIPLDRSCLKMFRVFDYAYFRWETNYFKEKFLEALAKISVNQKLEEEFERLAKTSDSFPKNLIHRDLQSQNIMIKKGLPYLIDYQGARIGPAGYDIASLLWDPYYRLEKQLREELLEYYIETRQKKDPTFEKDIFLASLPYLRVQRHLQALGAYANLALFKGKKYFLKFIPQTLEYLKEEVKLLRLFQLENTLKDLEKEMVEPVGLEPTTS
ncbi:phosphotransferase [Thermodesulfobacterium sp. TA1]|nr:phosphotransferase [Thermodesulfobacterium sp. TA1]